MVSLNNFEGLRIVRGNSDNKDFTVLVKLLDKDLLERYGDQQSFFDQFNKLDTIKNVVVAFVQNDPVACGAMKRYDDDSMEIKRMFVKEKYRGQGIAKQILRELERWAIELNYTSCVLETGKGQPEAIALYQNVGYKVIENYGQYIGIDNSICMRKKLV